MKKIANISKCKGETDVIHSFDPVVDENTILLILGTMPSEQSLKLRQYYGNPRNHFWNILFELFSRPVLEKYEDRLRFLLDRGIGLWDVLANCERRGSLDSRISQEEPNDFTFLIQAHPTIQTIVFNGGKAEQLFRKRVGFRFPGIRYKSMPSTSPTPGRNVKTYVEKVAVWRGILVD
jgi:TDG/mug DNA glycosylase family protein